MASVFSYSSVPTNRLRSHSPSCMEAFACAMLRAQASDEGAIVCSAADTRLEVGALHTMMPRSVAASTSTLSTTTPARPMTRSFSAASSTRSVTFVADLMIRAS